MCPHPLTEAEKVGREINYVQHLEQLAATDEFTSSGPIGALCVLGDISNRAHSDEFKLADAVILKIAHALNLTEDKIFFVPGNHDVHWPVMSMEPKSFWTDYRYAPLLQKDLLFDRRVKAAAFGALDLAPYCLAWNTSDAFIVGINSAAYDGPDEKTHSGLIKQESIAKLETILTAKPFVPGQLRICLLHHHPIQYSEPSPDVRDTSIAVNSENLLTLLSHHRFDLILHGHKHQPRLKSHHSNNSHPYITMCAGTFSAVLDPLQSGTITNAFHVINVEGRDSDTLGIKGKVETWSFSPQEKWKRGHQITGMPFLEVFGSNATSAEIDARVAAALSAVMSAQGYCKWSAIVAREPELEYIRTDSVFTAMKSASDVQGFSMVGDPQSPVENWMVFKG